MSETDALFTPDGDRFVPTELSVGPWSPDALHGGPVAALLCRELETLRSPCPMRLTRITVELIRPVPVAPLWVISQVVREGSKVNIVEASLGREDGAEVAKVRGLRIRTEDVEFPDGATDDVPPLPTEAADVSTLVAGSRVARGVPQPRCRAPLQLGRLRTGRSDLRLDAAPRPGAGR